MIRSLFVLFGVLFTSLNSQAWYATNGNHDMWAELNKKSPDCAAIFRTIFRKTDKSSGQTQVRDTFIYEGPNGKGFMDSEMSFDFSSAGSAEKESANAAKVDTQLGKAEKGLKDSKKTVAEVLALKPAGGEQVPDDEAKNIFSKVCLMVPESAFQGKSPCPAGMKGFKLNPQIILCKDPNAAKKK